MFVRANDGYLIAGATVHETVDGSTCPTPGESFIVLCCDGDYPHRTEMLAVLGDVHQRLNTSDRR